MGRQSERHELLIPRLVAFKNFFNTYTDSEGDNYFKLSGYNLMWTFFKNKEIETRSF